MRSCNQFLMGLMVLKSIPLDNLDRHLIPQPSSSAFFDITKSIQQFYEQFNMSDIASSHTTPLKGQDISRAYQQYLALYNQRQTPGQLPLKRNSFSGSSMESSSLRGKVQPRFIEQLTVQNIINQPAKVHKSNSRVQNLKCSLKPIEQPSKQLWPSADSSIRTDSLQRNPDSSARKLDIEKIKQKYLFRKTENNKSTSVQKELFPQSRTTPLRETNMNRQLTTKQVQKESFKATIRDFDKDEQLKKLDEQIRNIKQNSQSRNMKTNNLLGNIERIKERINTVIKGLPM